MILYHFTAERFLSKIKKSGLTKGRMLKSIRTMEFIEKKQWLTKNPDWNQEWARGTGALPYSRNEVRLTVEIPDKMAIKNLKSWEEMSHLTPEVAKMLSSKGDPENWMIYSGNIYPPWIKKIERRG